MTSTDAAVSMGHVLYPVVSWQPPQIKGTFVPLHQNYIVVPSVLESWEDWASGISDHSASILKLTHTTVV